MSWRARVPLLFGNYLGDPVKPGGNTLQLLGIVITVQALKPGRPKAWGQQCGRRTEGKAAALNRSPQLLRPESGKQEVVSTGKKEGALKAGQQLWAPCPRPSHASPWHRERPQLRRHLARPLTSLVHCPPPLVRSLGAATATVDPSSVPVPGLELCGSHWPRGDEPCHPGRCTQRARGCGHKATDRLGAVGPLRVPELGPSVRARPAARNHGSRRLGAQPPSTHRQPPRCQGREGGGDGPGTRACPFPSAARVPGRA
ncbi:uncharacterized protein isoform X1 [Castor canadensis]|uniref:Uncharacterized protein isoform X1 n=10 Tax=Castor canadensis TaxID=51338 RepID=A0AC58NGR7_CASCN